MTWKSIIAFWFKECKPAQWFTKSAAFDRRVRKRFMKTYSQVVQGKTAEWRKTPRGRLAEIIVLDQFARNMFRGTSQSFAHDALALALAQEAIRARADKKLSPIMRRFLYMPFMHSESKAIQKQSLALFASVGETRYARDHKKIIDRFGRFPHRNRALGRTSTIAERKFMRAHKGY